jgi:hypothetical protein
MVDLPNSMVEKKNLGRALTRVPVSFREKTHHKSQHGSREESCNNVLTGELMRVPLNRGSYLVPDDPAEIPLENGGGPNGNRTRVTDVRGRCPNR